MITIRTQTRHRRRPATGPETDLYVAILYWAGTAVALAIAVALAMQGYRL